VKANEADAAALVALGAFECSLAVLVFRLRRRAFPLGLLYFAVTAVLIVSSWTLWDGWAGEMLRLRRAWQGRGVLPGEVEMLQRIIPEAMFVGPALTALGLFLARRRLDS
jgi:hypothetical protein